MIRGGFEEEPADSGGVTGGGAVNVDLKESSEGTEGAGEGEGEGGSGGAGDDKEERDDADAHKAGGKVMEALLFSSG